MADPEVEWIVDEGAFHRLAGEWDRLAERAGIPFLRHAWFTAWWDAFGAGRSLRICVARRDGELAAAFPLCGRGRSLHALANEQTPLYTPLGSGDALAAVVAAAVDVCTAIDTIAMPASDPAVELLEDAARRRGLVVYREPHAVSPIASLRGSFEDYSGRIPRSLRKDARRRRRRLETEHDVAFELVAVPDDLDAALTRGFAVEASGWKGRRGTAVGSRPDTERFYRELGRAFAAERRLRLSMLRADDADIAFDYCVLDANRLWSLKLGFDEAYARYGPGNLLTLAEIERCYELGLDALELLGDAEPWKTRFADSARELVNMRVYARRPSPLARYAYRRAVRPVARSVYRRAIEPRLSGRRRSRSR